ncbi:MAG: trypsin-like serine protease, partial [Thermoguttaceae bacterium]
MSSGNPQTMGVRRLVFSTIRFICVVCATAAISGLPRPARGVTGPGTTQNTNPEIGTVLSSSGLTAPNGTQFVPTGSATLVNNLTGQNANNTLVLTAAHVTNGLRTPNPASFSFHQFRANNANGTPTVEALAVPCPGWVRSTGGTVSNVNDISLMFTLSPVATGQTAIPIATTAAAVNTQLLAVGYSNGTGATLATPNQNTVTV